VFEEYHLVSITDLRLAAQRREEYLKSQMGTISGTMADCEAEPETLKLLISQDMRL
jgi:hypothetical protein